MTREAFDRLVRTVEERYAQRPGALRRQLVLLAAAGYLGLFAWLGVLFVLAALLMIPAMITGEGGAWILAAVGWGILLIVGAAIIRTLWVRLPTPEGRFVSAREAPALHAMLEELRRSLRAARFHRVVINPSCNAAVSEIPRLGVLGWPRHYLILGLPLLDALSVEELRAVLAHEFAHLSARHGRVSSWVYRLRRSWEQIFERLQQPHVRESFSLRPLLIRFIDWFWPRFNAHAFVLSRAHEFEADAAAARLASPAHLSGALLRLQVASRLLDEKFWPDLWQSASQHATPPPAVFHALRESLHAGPTPADGEKWVAQAFDFVSSNADTHPCLAARWQALGIRKGEVSIWPLAAHPSAAETLLGPVLDSVRADIEQQWRKVCEVAWRESHGKAASLQARLQSLHAAVPDPGADAESLWDKACVVMNLQGDAAAEPLLRQVLALRPAYAPAHFCLGRHLLAINDDAAEFHLERAMDEDEDLVPTACEALLVHFQRNGNTTRIRELEARLDAHEAAIAASQAERFGVASTDTLIPHGLDPETLAPLCALLEADPDVIRAELAQKQLRHFPKQKFFLLCIRVRRPWHGMADRTREQAIANRFLLKARLPGRVLIFAPVGSFRALATRITKMKDSTIFERALR